MIVPTVIITALIAVAGVGSGQFIKSTNDCTCPGDIVIYNCNVTGSGFTIWRGSAFDCRSVDSRILLRHSLFGSSGTMGRCNDGAIMGRSTGITRSSSNSPVYMSQLMVNLTASSNVIGQDIQCIYRNTANVERTIGSATIEIEDPVPPPAIVRLVGTNSEQLVFNWTSVDSGCSTLKYNILSNCGNCINMTAVTATSVACSISINITDSVIQCSFGVQSVVCANISGIPSAPIDVTLKVPESPTISSVVAQYSEQEKKLTKLDVEFNEVEKFMISEGVNGSALSYTISYTDSKTGEMCNSLTISASSCKQGICTVPLIRPLPCSETVTEGDIDISISANNRLGQGSPSVTNIGQTNKYVNITFQSTNQILCTFLDQQGGQNTISCDVAYGPCQQEPIEIARGTVTATSNIVNISINPQMSEYCYVVNASNGTLTVLVEGQIMSTGNLITTDSELPPDDPSVISTKARDIAIGVSVPFAVLIPGLVIVVVLVILKVKQLQHTRGDQNFSHRTTMITPGEGATAGDDTIPGEYATDFIPTEAMQIVTAHICFTLEDKPNQLLSALTSLTVIDPENPENLKINIKNITIGPLQNKKRRIYIEKEDHLSETDRDLIIKKITVDGHTPEEMELEIFPETKSILIKTETTEYPTQKKISEVLKHQPGALCGLINAVLSIDDDKRINITDITVEDAGRECKRVTIKFFPVLEDTWEKKYDENKGKMCEFIVNSDSSSVSS